MAGPDEAAWPNKAPWPDNAAAPDKPAAPELAATPPVRATPPRRAASPSRGTAVGQPAAPGAEPALPPAAAETIRAAVHDEFDQVLQHVVEALRRNKAFDELSDRLRTAERRLEARRERPLVAALHRLLDHLRHLDFDPLVKDVLEAEIVTMLLQAGFEETGRVGETYDPARHEAIGGRAEDGRASVVRVDTRGLSSFGDVVFRAKVQISPQTMKDE
jgi:molecular chaperone GrpE (heat shock protein)